MTAPSKTPPIYVTKPSLPPLEELIPYLEQIWKNGIITNGGPFHQQLEQALCDYLGVKYLSLFTNGTIALVTALQALRIELINHRYQLKIADDGKKIRLYDAKYHLVSLITPLIYFTNTFIG